MADITTDIQSLTAFRRRSGEFLRQLKSKRPVVLTVNGKAAAFRTRKPTSARLTWRLGPTRKKGSGRDSRTQRREEAGRRASSLPSLEQHPSRCPVFRKRK
jgi:hypothetical protein